MCNYDDSERASFHDAIERKAKKEHKCYECGRAILPGEKYEYTKGVWAGEFSTYKTCSHCCVVREWISDSCGGFVYGCVEEEIREHAHAKGSMKLYRWAVAMGRKWQRFKTPALMPAPAVA